MNVDDPLWDHSTFSFGRERLFNEEVAQQFFDNAVLVAQLRRLTSNEYFSVDGVLLEARASHKNSRPKDGSGDDDDDFRGKPRNNDERASTTDPDARLARKGKGKEAKLSYRANTLMENRNGLLMGVDACRATGMSERDGALRLIDEMYLGKDCTLGADKGYDTHASSSLCCKIEAFSRTLRKLLPAVVARSAMTSQRLRNTPSTPSANRFEKRTEQPFAWSKAFGGLGKPMRAGLPDVKARTLWVFAARNDDPYRRFFRVRCLR